MILDCNEILENRLWVGCYPRVDEVASLKQLDISAVLSLQSDGDLAEYSIPIKKLIKAYESADIEFHRIPTMDFDKQALGANLAIAVEKLEAILTPKWAKAYVHCTAGINRAPTLAAAYLIKTQQMLAIQAYDYVMARRHCRPYLSTLEEYEATLRVQNVELGIQEGK
jgi:protein-tyrosine phosphatase